jgi:hypothetical protein
LYSVIDSFSYDQSLVIRRGQDYATEHQN